MENIKINYSNNTITETTENVTFQLVEDDVLYRKDRKIFGSFNRIANVLAKHYPRNNAADFKTVTDIALASVLVSVNMNVKRKIKQHEG